MTASLIVAGVAALVVLVALARAVQIIPQAHAAVIERWGRYLRTLDAGLHTIVPFIHRPLSRYVNALVAAGLLITRMEEPAPPPGFLARAEEYADAATIPRLLFLRAEKYTSVISA